MASTSASTNETECSGLEFAPSEYTTATETSITSLLSGAEDGDGSRIEEQIERSKTDWSEVARSDSGIDQDDEEAVKADNVEVFKALQMNPKWGTFFATFGHDYGIRGSSGELVVGKKFAEGGQGEIYEVQVKWWYPKDNEHDLNRGTEHVLKVFKKGTLLRQLLSQFPQGILQDHEDIVELSKDWRGEVGEYMIATRHVCEIYCAMLLEDGRFAFLMKKEEGDLRRYINRHMELRISQDSGPFSRELAEGIMYCVALGMTWLHNRNIVHRDLKASNVLYVERNKSWNNSWVGYVADYECSIGVIGSGFFRAPEILQACKDGILSQRPDLFSKAVDVYSYGMTCFEILTGELPFEGHPRTNYDLVLQGQRPKLPTYVDDWVCQLLAWCWKFHPKDRPTFVEILEVLEANSLVVKSIRESIVEKEALHDRKFKSFPGTD